MNHYPQSIINLIRSISKLPGIGEKTAERLALHLLRAPNAESEILSKTILEMKERVRLCKLCFALSDDELCNICRDPARNAASLCVVEQPADMVAIEKSGAFTGLYHILQGVLSPIDGIGPDGIRIKALLSRVAGGGIKEVVLATGTEARLVDAELIPVISPLNLVGQSTPSVFAVQLDPDQDRAALIVDGAVFWSAEAPTDLADADLQLLRNFAFGTDLTGDGYPELVSWAQPDDSDEGRLEVEVVSFDPSDPDGDGTPFGLLWQFSAADEPDLAGYQVIGTEGWSVRPADLDGGGVSEVILACVAPATYEFMLVALDGVTGAVELLLPVDFMLSSGLPKQMPIWVDDIDATLKGLKDRGLDVDPDAARTGRSGCRQYFIADPDGVRIELMQLMPDSLQAGAIRSPGE